MHHLHARHFPFTALVGQEQLRLALILNAINPRIGGVLIRGQKGTAKSTAARGLAEVLPEIEVVAGCPYHCHPTDSRGMCDACEARFQAGEPLVAQLRHVPFITLPLGATEDRVVGSIDVSEALQSGRAELKPGLLAQANRGILYVDEVNLLDDHLVNLLLDAAAMGRNIVEREGLSVVHPARFVLIGTMNPEEGELRPQLLDRFGIAVDIEGICELEARVEVLERLAEFDRAPEKFAARFSEAQHDLSARIQAATTRLDSLSIDRDILEAAAKRALVAGVDGHRADLTMVKVAVTLAAWHDESQVTEAHLEQASALVLPHRRRRKPFERPCPSEMAQAYESDSVSPQDRTAGKNEPVSAPQHESEPSADSEQVTLPVPRAAGSRAGSGAPGSMGLRGQRLGSRQRKSPSEPVDVAATLLSAATRQGRERKRPVPEVAPEDLRTTRVSSCTRRAICFVVDASGSMAARGRLSTARSAARKLLEESYQGRHRVSLVLASGGKARVSVKLTRDAEVVERAVAEAKPGGKTPLAHAIDLAASELARARGKGMSPTLVVLTDGRANVPLRANGDPLADVLAVAEQLGESAVDCLVVDTENDFVNIGLGRDLADRLGADYLRCKKPDAENIVDWVQRMP